MTIFFATLDQKNLRHHKMSRGNKLLFPKSVATGILSAYKFSYFIWSAPRLSALRNLYSYRSNETINAYHRRDLPRFGGVQELYPPTTALFPLARSPQISRTEFFAVGWMRPQTFFASPQIASSSFVKGDP